MWNTIREVLPQTLSRLGLGEKMEHKAMLDQWEVISPQFLTPKIARMVRAIAYRSHVLVLEVPQQAVFTELQMARHRILKAFQEQFPEKDVQAIRIIVREKEKTKKKN